MENKTTKKSKVEMFKQYLKGRMAFVAIALFVIGLGGTLQSGMSRNLKMTEYTIRSVGDPEAAVKAAELARTNIFSKLFNNGIILTPMLALAGVVFGVIAFGFGITFMLDGVKETEKDKVNGEEKASFSSFGMGLGLMILSIVMGVVFFWPIKA